MTFLGCFLAVAIGLKFFRIDFSSPQFFLGMVIITALVEMFFYVHRHGAPLHIAVVPGAANLAKPPKSTAPINQIHVADRRSKRSSITAVSLRISALNLRRVGTLSCLLGSSGHSSVSREAVQRVDHRASGRRSSVGEHVRRNRPGAYLPAIQARLSISCGALLLLPVVVLIIGVCAIFIKLRDTWSDFLSSAAHWFGRSTVYHFQAADNGAET